ncbi:hypothetical protein [Arthrobacter sp.]|uniref:hypothetical protein n=1 Tax=Arthrobacter sp. TaxID=1667 RepID=UPI002810A4FD|nr:hypothetical protein [Arthrobacter sp.]
MTENQRSFTLTALIFFGVLVAVAGVAMLFSGVSGGTTVSEIPKIVEIVSLRECIGDACGDCGRA